MLIAIVPFAGLAILAIGSIAAFVLLTPGANPPPVGTRVVVGTVGELAVEAVQQTTAGVEWHVRRADGSKVGSGAGRYDQAPLADMLDVAFGAAGPHAAVTLTFLAEGRTDERAKAHGDVTISVHEQARSDWSWSVADDAHDIFAMGEGASRGAALLEAEQASSGHLGLAAEGLGDYPAPPMPEPVNAKSAHGAAFPACAVQVYDAPTWLTWARAQIVAAFDAQDGMPTPDDLLDATVAQAMIDAGGEPCDLDDLRFGTASWDDVEPKLATVLEAIADPTFLSIPGPDELMAAALGGITPDNRGTKEAFGTWAIVVRPTDVAGAKAFAWWAWNGARLLDSDADLHGWAATQGEALALAKVAIQGQPAAYEAHTKE